MVKGGSMEKLKLIKNELKNGKREIVIENLSNIPLDVAMGELPMNIKYIRYVIKYGSFNERFYKEIYEDGRVGSAHFGVCADMVSDSWWERISKVEKWINQNCGTNVYNGRS